MNLKVSFSWIGLAIFTLPMLINLAYVIFPPAEKAETPAAVTHWIEMIEQISRIAYLLAITILVSREPINLQNMWLCLAVVFLILYYVVWMRYFMGGREIELLSRSFLFVPMPLAVFPVLYYLCTAIWLHNIPAALIMLIFGATHMTVSLQSFHSGPA